MREATVARTYASALFELGRQHDESDAYSAAFRELDHALAADARVQRFLETPKIDAQRKQAVLRTALEGRVPERFLRFVLLVIAKRRQRLLPQIRTAFDVMLDEHAGRVHARVALAREPDPDTVADIGARLTRLLGMEVVPHIEVNPDIVGGILVRYGDRVLDGSVRRQLVRMKRDMMQATLRSRAAGAKP